MYHKHIEVHGLKGLDGTDDTRIDRREPALAKMIHERALWFNSANFR